LINRFVVSKQIKCNRSLDPLKLGVDQTYSPSPHDPILPQTGVLSSARIAWLKNNKSAIGRIDNFIFQVPTSTFM
jgi:hypothetical protein